MDFAFFTERLKKPCSSRSALVRHLLASFARTDVFWRCDSWRPVVAAGWKEVLRAPAAHGVSSNNVKQRVPETLRVISVVKTILDALRYCMYKFPVRKSAVCRRYIPACVYTVQSSNNLYFGTFFVSFWPNHPSLWAYNFGLPQYFLIGFLAFSVENHEACETIHSRTVYYKFW